MPLDPILIVYKKVHLSSKPKVISAGWIRYSRRMRHAYDSHHRTLDLLRDTLKSMGLKYRYIHRARVVDEKAYKLIITVGGDGTFLRAAQSVYHTPMLGINSDPTRSEGFFTAADASTLKKTLQRWSQGRLKLTALSRLQLRMDGILIKERVLNEVLITHANAAAVCRYRIEVGSRSEEHKSSGVWVATAAGSSAAVHSAGGKVLPVRSKRYQYMVRELYAGVRLTPEKPALRAGTLAADARIRFEALMTHMEIYLDGPHVMYKFPLGSRLEVRRDPRPLNAFGVG
ncbi:MAG: NAD(+)/NADH kinase [Candidatus Omnitrophica bacterium]|nr:NAD(+)/NADH kinase [Candidatus Omnitrophota bacterium]